MSSLIFNTIDMSPYGLTVTKSQLPVNFTANSYQLLDKSYADTSKSPPKTISLEVAIYSLTLEASLDSIKAALNSRIDGNLYLATDRYWVARFMSMEEQVKTKNLWRGTIQFACYDPFAYDTIELDPDFTIDDDPENITFTPGGTGKIEPVYTITPDGNYPGAVVLITNNTTGEIFEWTGNLTAASVLVIDVANWTVELDGVDAMTGLDTASAFPYLVPTVNLLEIDGFTGNLNIKYRKRYI
jgi:phage-related protein